MKIALITDGIYPYVVGGMPKLAYYLSRHFSLLGIDLTVIHCVPYGQKKISEKELNLHLFPNNEANVKSICLEFPKASKYPGHYIRESIKYSTIAYKALKKDIEEFDIIYTKGFTGITFIKERKRNKRIPPVAVQLHGLEMFQKAFDFKSKLQMLILQSIAKRCLVEADVVFSYDGYIKKKHIELGVDPNKIIIQYGCVPADRLKTEIQKTSQPLKFLYIARNERRKGIPELHDVVRKLIKVYNFEFYVIGKIDESIKIIHPNAYYIGLISNEDQYYETFKDKDILLFSSISDGFPTVIIEAMSQGLSVLATDVGAVSSAVSNDVGWLVPVNFELYGQKLEEIIRTPFDVIDSKKSNAISKVKNNFVWEHGVNKLISDIKNWLKQN